MKKSKRKKYGQNIACFFQGGGGGGGRGEGRKVKKLFVFGYDQHFILISFPVDKYLIAQKQQKSDDGCWKNDKKGILAGSLS